MFQIGLKQRSGAPIIQNGHYIGMLRVSSFSESFPANRETLPETYAEVWRSSAKSICEGKVGIFPTSLKELSNDDSSCWFGMVHNMRPTFLNILQPLGGVYLRKGVAIAKVDVDVARLLGEPGVTKLQCELDDIVRFVEDG